MQAFRKEVCAIEMVWATAHLVQAPNPGSSVQIERTSLACDNTVEPLRKGY